MNTDNLKRAPTIVVKHVVKDGSRSTPVLFILFLVFLILKLTSTITWSWWWVTAPLWMPVALVFGIIGVIGTIFLLVIIVAAIVAGIAFIFNR
jgi:hypothetical protein